MNVDDGIGTAIGQGVQARKQLKATKSEQARLEQERARAEWTQNQLDYKPEYASDHVGAYQRSTSPVADAFLNSMLTGDNENAVQSTRRGAPQARAAAQQGFAQNYGGWDALRQQQTAQNATTPWQVTPVTREISKPDLSKKAFEAGQLGYVDKTGLGALEAAGFGFRNGRFREKYSSKPSRDLMRSLGLNTDMEGGEGQKVLAGLAHELESGRKLEDIIKETQGGGMNYGEFVFGGGRDQRKNDFVSRYTGVADQPKVTRG